MLQAIWRASPRPQHDAWRQDIPACHRIAPGLARTAQDGPELARLGHDIACIGPVVLRGMLPALSIFVAGNRLAAPNCHLSIFVA